MKKLMLITAMIAFLSACSDPTDLKLSETNEPENAKKLLETLSPEDLSMLKEYVINHAMENNIDYKMTVKEAIEARKKEIAQEK